MLKIIRRCKHSFYISDDVKITVIGVEDGTVHFGIDAPEDINIAREESLLGGKEYTVTARDLTYNATDLQDALDWAKG